MGASQVSAHAMPTGVAIKTAIGSAASRAQRLLVPMARAITAETAAAPANATVKMISLLDSDPPPGQEIGHPKEAGGRHPYRDHGQWLASNRTTCIHPMK